MLKEEFLKETGLEDISGSHFEEINYIYTFHPSISETGGKKQIAQIYLAGGMAAIRDMTKRAMLQERLERKKHNIQEMLLSLDKIYFDNKTCTTVVIEKEIEEWEKKYE